MELEKMYEGKVNSPATFLVREIDKEATEIEVTDIDVLPKAPNIACIGTGLETETIMYESIEGNTLKGCVRGFQGVAKDWSILSVVSRIFTEYDLGSLQRNLSTLDNELEESNKAVDKNTKNIKKIKEDMESHIKDEDVHVANKDRENWNNTSILLNAKAPISQPNFIEKEETTAAFSEDLKTEAILGTGWTGDMPTFRSTTNTTGVLSLPIDIKKGRLYRLSFTRLTTSTANNFNIIFANTPSEIEGQEILRAVNADHTLFVEAEEDYRCINVIPTINFAGTITWGNIEEVSNYNSESLRISNIPLIVKNKNIIFNSKGERVIGSGNIFLGEEAGGNNVTGSNNICIGEEAGANNINGSGNIYIGEKTGHNVAIGENGNVVLGNGAATLGTALGTNQIVIGNGAISNGSNRITLGNNQITQLRCQVNAITAMSDSRVKEHVEPANLNICYETIKNLPVSRYKYKTFTGAHVDENVTGFMADDVEKVFPKSVSKADTQFPVLDKKGNQVFETKIVKEKVKETYEVIEEVVVKETNRKTKELENIIKKVPVLKTRIVEKEVEKEVPKMFVMKDVKEITMTEAVPTLWGALQKVMEKLEAQEERVKELETKSNNQ